MWFSAAWPSLGLSPPLIPANAGTPDEMAWRLRAKSAALLRPAFQLWDLGPGIRRDERGYFGLF